MRTWIDAPTVRWELWASDTFDRRAKPSMDRSGTGLITGLAELWATVLRQGIVDGGSASFTSFSLVVIQGEWRDRTDLGVQPSENQALAELRRWIYGGSAQDQDGRGPDEAGPEQGQQELLEALAATHAALLPRDRRFPFGWEPGSPSHRILAEVDASRDVDALRERLSALRTYPQRGDR